MPSMALIVDGVGSLATKKKKEERQQKHQ